ncbi:MAG: S-layer homology domain-containing protein [bacterium]
MKRQLKNIIIIPSFVICSLVICHSALAVDGTTLDPSRNVYSARQLGMGGVSVGFSDDASGILTNPSGLADIIFPEITAASRKLVLDETQYNLFAWAVPTQYGTIGLAYSGLNTAGSLPTKQDVGTGRIIVDPSREATSYDNSVVAISYSRVLPYRNVALGINYKLFNQRLTGDTNAGATGTALDIGFGLQYNPWLKLGAMFQNIGGSSVSWTNNNDKLGGFYKFGAQANLLGPSGEAWKDNDKRLNAGVDFAIPHSLLSASNGLSYQFGLEYFPYDNIALRTGLNQESSLTYGIGVLNGGFRFDYAFVQRPEIPGDTPHYFSLSFVGERVFSSKRKLKTKQASLAFIAPKDRLITDQKTITISAEAKTVRVMDETYTWTVTAVSATAETHQATEVEPLLQVYLNGESMGNETSITATPTIGQGRNVFELIGYTSPDATAGITSAESMTATLYVLGFTPSSDMSLDYWAAEPIALCVTLGLVKGYPDDTFKPEKGITRAELVTLLVRSLGLPDAQLEAEAFSEFTDLTDGHWATKYVAYASRNKIVTGYPNGSFQPNQVVSRAEGITILARYAKLNEDVEAKSEFTDLADTFWANKYIAPAKKAGLLNYLNDKPFEAAKEFTRAEACEVLYRTPHVQSMVEQWWTTGIASTMQPTTAPSVEAEQNN